MARKEQQRQMYELEGATTAQRVLRAVSAGTWIAVAWWLLLGPGQAVRTSWVRAPAAAGNLLRRPCIWASFAICYLRTLVTGFVFLRRGVSWSEAATVAAWLLFIVMLISIRGGTKPARPGWLDLVGVILFLAGSWINTYSEYQRHKWKGRPENLGKLYTEGLFRYCRHPNYFGDLLLFSGICITSGSWFAAIVPALMLAGFVSVNIPLLDAHRRERYGSECEKYASQTRKLIPFIW